jgi:hypothetical protein
MKPLLHQQTHTSYVCVTVSTHASRTCIIAYYMATWQQLHRQADSLLWFTTCWHCSIGD